MNLEHYKKYTTDDFIFDEDFREIVKNRSNGKLKELLEIFPDKKQDINLAVQILRELHTKEFRQTEKRKQQLWQQIIQKRKKQVRLLYFRYAASLLLFIGIGSTVFYISTQKQMEKVVVSDALPSNDAMLILANGEKVAIISLSDTSIPAAVGLITVSWEIRFTVSFFVLLLLIILNLSV